MRRALAALLLAGCAGSGGAPDAWLGRPVEELHAAWGKPLIVLPDGTQEWPASGGLARGEVNVPTIDRFGRTTATATRPTTPRFTSGCDRRVRVEAGRVAAIDYDGDLCAQYRRR